MSKVKVRLADNIARVIFIEKDATVGAQLGTDFRMPDGTLATAATLASYLGVSSAASSAPSAHRLLTGLTLGDDHPQYTRRDILTTHGDLYFRGVSVIERLALGTDRKFLRAGTSDPSWETVSPVITLSTDLSGNVTLANLASATLAATIANNAVSYAKMQNVSAASKLLGRGSAAGAGDPQEITLGAGLTMTGTTLSASGGGGGGSANVTADTHPTVADSADDEFETGSNIDTAGARFAGATPWTAFGLSTGIDAVAQGALTFSPALTASRNWGGYSQPVSGTWGYTCKITTANWATFSLLGMFVATSSGAAGNIIILGVNADQLVVQRLTSNTAFSSNPLLAPSSVPLLANVNTSEIYLRVTYDLTNLNFYVSFSGVDGSFVRLYTETSAAFLGTPGLIGIGGDNESASVQSAAVIDWFRRTSGTSAPPASLLHFDGTDTSTAIVDEYSPTWTAVGDAQLDTALAEFGVSSLLLDGVGDYVDMDSPGHAFGTGDFTIEGFVNFSALSGNNFVFGFGAGWGIYTFSGQWAVFDGISTNVIQGGATTTATWYHIALSRAGTSLRFFVNGTQVSSTATDSTNHTATAFRIGAQTSGSGPMAGHVDEVRISDRAVYTAGFTPPAAPFPPP